LATHHATGARLSRRHIGAQGSPGLVLLHDRVEILRFYGFFYAIFDCRLKLATSVMTNETAPMPKISVVTPSFNGVRTIRATLESVAGQDYAQVEHIVVDGGYTDGTLGVLKDYPRMISISERDEGHYHAMDKGTRMASGGVVAILNADDCYRPGVLRVVAKAFEKRPDWDGVLGYIVFVDGQCREIFRRR